MFTVLVCRPEERDDAFGGIEVHGVFSTEERALDSIRVLQALGGGWKFLLDKGIPDELPKGEIDESIGY